MKGKKHIVSRTARRRAMHALVGLWKDRKDISDSNAYVRRVRKGNRIKRVAFLGKN